MVALLEDKFNCSAEKVGDQVFDVVVLTDPNFEAVVVLIVN